MDDQVLKGKDNGLDKSIAPKPVLADLRTKYDSQAIQENAQRDLEKNGIDQGCKAESNIYQALTLREFDNGVLLSESFRGEFKTFVIDFSKRIQQEYDCKTVSQRATAEFVANAYVRTLQTQMMITKYLNLDGITDMGIKYLAVLSKELDRANRHYVMALQTLSLLKQGPMSITIKTQTANIANNQLVQENNVIKPI